jgi:methylmalonyl-CoA mutase, N-terminal domain
MLAAVERGYPQSEIQQQAYDWQRSIETDERTIVSVNKYVTPAQVPLELQRDSAGESEQNGRLAEYKERRAGDAWRVECEKLTALAHSGERFGYCEQIIACLRARATEGEIVRALEQVWGRHRPRY